VRRNWRWWLGWAIVVVSLGTFFAVGAAAPQRSGTDGGNVPPTLTLLGIVFFALVASGGVWLVHASKFTNEQRRNAAKMKAHEREFSIRRVR